MHPQAKKVSVIAFFLIILIILGLITWYLIKNWPKFGGALFGPTGSAPTNPLQDISLEGYSLDQGSNVNIWVIFKYKGEHFLVNQNSQGSGGFAPTNIKDVFPTFTGNVIDFVAISGHANPSSISGLPALFVFSDNGQVYSNFTGTPYSQTLWQGWMFLPHNLTALVGVDATFGGKSDIAYPGKGILFKFYFDATTDRDGNPVPAEIYEEQGCTAGRPAGYGATVQGMNGVTLNTPTPSKCPNSQSAWNMTYSDRIAAVSGGRVIGGSGNIFDLSSGTVEGVWENSFFVTPKYIKAVYDDEHANNATSIRATAMASGETPFNNENYDFHLMAADHEHGIPYYMTNENGISFLVTPNAKKITLDKVLNISYAKYLVVHDFTKLTEMENDFLIMAADGYMYNPYFAPDADHYPRIDFTAFQTKVLGRQTDEIQNSWLSGVTHVNSYTKGYRVCFFFSNGDWFFVTMNPTVDKRTFGTVDSEYFFKAKGPMPEGTTAVNPGQMSWLDWKHVAPAKNDIVNNNKADCITNKDGTKSCKTNSKAQYMVGIAYDDWTVYMWGTNNINGKMYSFSKQPPSSCPSNLTTDGSDNTDDYSGCWSMNVANQTGLGKWKDVDLESTFGEKDGVATNLTTFKNESMDGWVGISGHSISGQGAPATAGNDDASKTGHLIQTVYWINFEDAAAKAKTIPHCNVFVFDKVLMKAEYYEAAWRSIAVIDRDSDVFVVNSFYATYENAFCVKNSNGKYLYYDFVNQDTPKLALGDTCLAAGALPSDPTKASAILGEAMGAVWGYSASLDPEAPASQVCLQNLNPSLSAASNITSGYSSGPLSGACTSDGKPYKSGSNSPERWLLDKNGSFNNGSKCMYADGTSIKFASVGSSSCNNQWSVVSLKDDGDFCDHDKYPVCGADAAQQCMKTHDFGSCQCLPTGPDGNVPPKTYDESDPCYQKCLDYDNCTSKCLGPTLAMQCYN